MDAREKHSLYSTLRENIIEHLFAGQLLRRLWQWGVVDAELLKSEFDAGGYDLVLTCKSITRHIQLKVSLKNGARTDVSVNLRLADKPSGCIVWILVDDDLDFKGFRWFGGTPGHPLPEVHHLKVAKHSKGTSKGIKNERANHRSIKRSKFTDIADLDLLLELLLGHDLLHQNNGIHVSAARSQDFLYNAKGLPE